MKIIFIGGIINPKKIDTHIKNSRSSFQFAAQNFQLALIKSFENSSEKLSVFSIPFLSSFPKYSNELVVFNEKYNISKDTNVTSFGYINVPLIKQFNLLINSLVIIFKLFCLKEKTTIIIYSAQTYLMLIAILLKFIKRKTFNSILIIPDLPDFMNINSSKIKSLILFFFNKIRTFFTRYFDGYIFLTQTMQKYLKIKNKPFRIIETIIDLEIGENSYKKIQTNNLNVIYSGSLSAKYGIMNLLNAFKFIKDPNIRLVIFGDGELKNTVHYYSQHINNIIYKGSVNKNFLYKEYRNAALFVNPRENDEYTNYSFPSKLSEYLLFGKPVLCFRLSGIPKDYDKHLFYFSTNEPELMAKEIIKLCYLSKKDRKKIFKENTTFITKNKSIAFQGVKIKSLINEIGGS
jgi:hypothetical protein